MLEEKLKKVRTKLALYLRKSKGGQHWISVFDNECKDQLDQFEKNRFEYYIARWQFFIQSYSSCM